MTPLATVSPKSSKSNSLSFTKADRFILDKRQDPPAGRGSSAQGLTPAYSKVSSNSSRL